MFWWRHACFFQQVWPVAGYLGGSVNRQGPLMTLKEITPVRWSDAFAFQFMKLKVRDVFIRWKQALFLRRLAHEGVVNHEQIILLGQHGEWCFVTVVQAARFPLESRPPGA
jgi:hypothetical protein